MDRHDVGVAEHGRGASLTPEAVDEPGVVGQGGVEDLQGHLAVQDGVVSAIDLAHPAGGDPGDDLVAPVDGGLDHHGDVRGSGLRPL
jgi:hypothetical protein